MQPSGSTIAGMSTVSAAGREDKEPDAYRKVAALGAAARTALVAREAPGASPQAELQ